MPQQKTKVNNDKRARHFSFIAYPENIKKAELIDILSRECKQFAISPLHDSDMNADETQKKPHWHIYLYFDGKKNLNQVNEIAKKCKGVFSIVVNSRMALLQYFCHINNPEKAQYDISEIYAVGLNIEKEIYSPMEYNKRLRAEIHTLILNQNIVEYSALLDFLFSNGDMNEHYDYACNHTILFRAYLQSRRECVKVKSNNK